MKNKLNKVLSTTVVLSMVLAPGATYASSTETKIETKTTSVSQENFSDLAKAAPWAQNYIQQARELGLIKGDPDGKFRPLETITRREIAAILVNILKVDASSSVSSSFSDVASSDWGSKYIEAVNRIGVMQGDGNGKFRPASPITREELAIILVKAANGSVEGKGNELTVADAQSVGTWAKSYVQAAMEMGLLKGDGKNFNPKQKAARQEVAIMAMNLVNAVVTPAPTPQEPTGVVETVTDKTVTIDGTSYTLADAVKGIFNLANGPVLKGAKVKFEKTDKTITKLTYLEITSSGENAKSGEKEFSRNLLLDGKNASVEGDVKVSANYISFKNLTVKGDFEITKELVNDFYSLDLKVSGKTIVNGGDSNTVVFENSTLGSVEVNKKDVRVESKGNTSVSEVNITTDAVITADSGVTIPKITVEDGVSKVEVNATVSSLVLNGNGAVNVTGNGKIEKIGVTSNTAKVTLASNMTVADLTIPSGVKVEDVITNYSQTKNQIGNVNGSTPVSSGGGGGGGSNSATAPTLSNVTTGPVATNSTSGAGTISATSNDNGFIYLVPKGTAKTVLALEQAALTTGARVEATAGVAKQFNVSSFVPGTYVVYAVDSNGNISMVSNDIIVTGWIMLTPPVDNVVTDAFGSATTVTGAKLFSFQLHPMGEAVKFGQINIQANPATGINVSDMSNLKVYLDMNNDGVLDANEQITSNGSNGTINGGSTFAINALGDTALTGIRLTDLQLLDGLDSAHDIIVVADVSNLNIGDTVSFTLNTSNISSSIGVVTNTANPVEIGNPLPGAPQSVTHTHDGNPAAPTTAQLVVGTTIGTTKLTGVNNTMQYTTNDSLQYIDITGTEVDNIQVTSGDTIKVRYTGTPTQSPSEVQVLRVTDAEIRRDLILLDPSLTVWASNDDEDYFDGTTTYSAGSILQYNVNFKPGTTLGEFSQAAVDFYVGDQLVGTNTVKPSALIDSADSIGLTGLITAGPNAAEPNLDPFWNIGAYTSNKKPTKAVFKLVKDGIEYEATANFTPATVQIPDLITSPTLNVWDQNDDEDYYDGTTTYSAGSILQYNVNFKPGTTLGEFSQAAVDFYVADQLVGTNTVKPSALTDSADSVGLTGLITAGPNAAEPNLDPFWNIGAYTSSEKPTKAVFKLVKDGIEYEVTANFVGPISDLGLTTTGDTVVVLGFSAPTGATAVKVQQSTDNGGSWTDSTTTEVLTESSTAATVTGLLGGTSYRFKLVVTGGRRAGDSNVVDVVTDIAP